MYMQILWYNGLSFAWNFPYMKISSSVARFTKVLTTLINLVNLACDTGWLINHPLSF